MLAPSATASILAVALFFVLPAGWLLWPQSGVYVSVSTSVSARAHAGNGGGTPDPAPDCWLADTRFALRWRHSVERQLWFEHYRVASGQLVLEYVWLQTFGAGTPHAGTPVTAPPGFVGLRSGLRLPELNWTVSPSMQGELHTDHGRWPLAAALPPYTTVHLRPQRPPRFTTLSFNDCHAHFVPHPAT